MTSIRLPSLLLATAVALTLAACGKKEEPAPVVAPAPAPAPAPVQTPPPPPEPAGVTFASVTIGNAIDEATKTVTLADGVLKAKDTIYAAVATNGASPNATIAARWTFNDGQLVDESSQSIAPTGPAVTTFHIAKPDGFPTGKYKVDITLDGQPVGSQDFEVQ